MIPVYLAGPSQELPRVLRYAEQLEASGLVRLTHPWWREVQRHGIGQDATLPRAEQAKHAVRDLAGLWDARIVWFLWPHATSHGVAFEFGTVWARIDRDVHAVISGPKASEFIFTALAWRDPSDDVALVEVMRLARELENGHE